MVIQLIKRVQDACAYAMEVILANDLVDKAVVNLSLGANTPDAHEIIEQMNAAGIAVTVSAGNSARDVDVYVTSFLWSLRKCLYRIFNN